MTSMGTMPDLDIVIPVFNEGKNILNVMDALAASVHTSFRVLICYDHDNDDTLDALKFYQNPNVEIVLVKNRWQGPHGAVVTGFASGSAPAVLVFPADDTYNAEIIDRMFRVFREGSDVVVASRFMPGGRMEGCPWLKAFLVRVASFTLCHFARLPAHDATNGLRLFSRRLLNLVQIESFQGFTYSIELLVKCQRLGWNIGEVPALWFQRTVGESHFHVVKWLPAYLRWYFYAFATTYLRRGPDTVAGQTLHVSE
jgi:dolichol-phosphate mannosyltransferase